MYIALLSKLHPFNSCLGYKIQNIRKEWLSANFLLSSEPKGYQKRGEGKKRVWVKENRADVNEMY